MSPVYGRNGDTSTTLTLGQGEYITDALGGASAFVDWINFTTSLGRTLTLPTQPDGFPETMTSSMCPSGAYKLSTIRGTFGGKCAVVYGQPPDAPCDPNINSLTFVWSPAESNLASIIVNAVAVAEAQVSDKSLFSLSFILSFFFLSLSN